MFYQSRIILAASEIPTPDQMAGWTPSQFIQVGFGLLLIGVMSALVWCIRQMQQNTRDLNDSNDRMLAEMVKRYDNQDVRYEKQEIRHRERDDKTNDALRVGLEHIAEAIRHVKDVAR